MKEYIEYAQKYAQINYWTSENPKKVSLYNNDDQVLGEQQEVNFPNSNVIYKLQLDGCCNNILVCIHPNGEEQVFNILPDAYYGKDFEKVGVTEYLICKNANILLNLCCYYKTKRFSKNSQMVYYCVVNHIDKLIWLYYFTSESYNTILHWECQRFSNNYNPKFTAVEVLTIYFYGILEEKKTEIKSIHKHAQKHLLSWFPDLPNYPNSINGLIV